MNSEPWKSCTQFPESFTIGETEDFVEAHTWAQGLYLQFPRPGIKEVRCITANKKFIPSKMFQTLQMYFRKRSPMSAWDPRNGKKSAIHNSHILESGAGPLGPRIQESQLKPSFVESWVEGRPSKSYLFLGCQKKWMPT